MFADDTTLLYSAETLFDRSIGFDFVCLKKRITCNHMYLNVKKPELVWFCDPLRDIRLQNESLKNSDSVKYLSFHLERSLSLAVHVDKVLNACQSICLQLQESRSL